MQTQICRIENGLGVELPESFVSALKLASDSTVELTVVNGSLMISPVDISCECTLESLVSRITPENLHEEIELW